MNKTKIAFGIGIVALFAVLSVSAASAHVTAYFTPAECSVPEGECHSAYVEVWMDVTDPHQVKGGQFAIHYDPSCVNITEHPVALTPDRWGPCIDSSVSSWNVYPECWGPGYDMIMYTFAFAVPHAYCPSPQMIANFTVHCNSSEYCASNLSVSCGEYCWACPIEVMDPTGVHLYPDHVTLVDGTFECGELPPPETIEKELVTGWNLISLCFEPSDNSTSAVLSSIGANVTEGGVQKYVPGTGFVPATTMDRGKGYFVHVTQDCTWNHTGVNKTAPMTIPLEPGLNLVGYPFNWSKDTGDALSALNYYYTAPFDATDQKYDKTFNPVAPAPFNDFMTINPCEGFWVSSKDGGDWTAS